MVSHVRPLPLGGFFEWFLSLPGQSTVTGPNCLNCCWSCNSVMSHGTPPRNTLQLYKGFFVFLGGSCPTQVHVASLLAETISSSISKRIRSSNVPKNDFRFNLKLEFLEILRSFRSHINPNLSGCRLLHKKN